MISVGPRQVEASNECVVISSRIATNSGSRELWFQVPARFADRINSHLDPFVAAVVLLAMHSGEDIEARGSVSPRLAHGVQEYQRIFHSWFPSLLRVVTLRALSCSEIRNEAPGTASFFSGGVDSFFTLLSHCRENESVPGHAITSLLFVHGFDIPLEDESTFAVASRSYSELAAELGIELVPVATNLRQVTREVDWEINHGTGLAAVALMLSPIFGKVYIPATHVFSDSFPWGSDYRVDHLLSNDVTQLLHDGAHASRMEKMLAICGWTPSFNRLRVCWEKPDGLRNCGRCSKCLRTMIALELTGARERFTTFPHLPDSPALAFTAPESPSQLTFARDLLAYAEQLGRRDIEHVVRCAIRRARWNSWRSSLRNTRRRLRHAVSNAIG